MTRGPLLLLRLAQLPLLLLWQAALACLDGPTAGLLGDYAQRILRRVSDPSGDAADDDGHI